MQLPEFLIEQDGEIVPHGHRVGLFHVIKLYQDGCSPEMIACEYPTLPLAVIHKLIAFYLENRSDVDAYVAAYDADLERQETGAVRRLDVDTLRKRLEALRREPSALKGVVTFVP